MASKIKLLCIDVQFIDKYLPLCSIHHLMSCFHIWVIVRNRKDINYYLNTKEDSCWGILLCNIPS